MSITITMHVCIDINMLLGMQKSTLSTQITAFKPGTYASAAVCAGFLEITFVCALVCVLMCVHPLGY